MGGNILLGVLLFTGIVLVQTAIILLARRWLVPQGHVPIEINEEKTLDVAVGQKLLGALAANDLFIASACGGKGTCGQCLVRVTEGGGAMVPTEESLINKRDARDGVRLACQVAVKDALKIEVPGEVFGVGRWLATVRSNRNVSTFIKELVLDDWEFLLDLWWTAWENYREYHWVHRDECRRPLPWLFELAGDKVKALLLYLAENFWGRYAGWPDLIGRRGCELRFFEVKSPNDRPSEDQLRWFADNQEKLGFNASLIRVRKRRSP